VTLGGGGKLHHAFSPTLQTAAKSKATTGVMTATATPICAAIPMAIADTIENFDPSQIFWASCRRVS